MDCQHNSANGTGATLLGEQVWECCQCHCFHISVRVDFDYKVPISNAIVAALLNRGLSENHDATIRSWKVYA